MAHLRAQVTVVGEQVNLSLLEQAGTLAAVPTQARQQPPTNLRFQVSGHGHTYAHQLGAMGGGMPVGFPFFLMCCNRWTIQSFG